MMNDKTMETVPAATSAGTWMSTLTPQEKRTFWATFGGFGLDALNIQLYSFVIPVLIPLWSMSRTQAGMIATVSLIISAIGGWVGGIIADRIGRVVMLQITIVWFTFFTFISAFANSANELMVIRALQGLGFGAEWAIGAALMSEIVRPQHRGKILGFVQSSWAVGWGAAAILFAATSYFFPPETAWRVLFCVSAIPSIFVIYIRRQVKEPALFKKQVATGAAANTSFLDIFRGPVAKVTILTSLLATGVQGGFYAIMTWLPTYLKTVRHLSSLNTSGYLAVIIVAAFLGYVVGAYMSDSIGRKKTFALFSIGSIVTVISYTLVPISDSWMLVLGFPIGFCYAGSFTGLGSYLSELFPTRVRGAGMGFSYNFGRALGALFPALVGVLSQHIELGTAIGAFTVGSYTLVLLSLIALPETKGRELLE